MKGNRFSLQRFSYVFFESDPKILHARSIGHYKTLQGLLFFFVTQIDGIPRISGLSVRVDWDSRYPVNKSKVETRSPYIVS